MKKTITEENLQRRDRKLLAMGLGAFLLFSAPLVYKHIHSPKPKKSAAPTASSIGKITFIKNDTRYKKSDSLEWKKTRLTQNIYIGDSLYSGKKSQSQVNLNDHGFVDVDQNSMMTFYRINNQEIPNLASGNFRVTVEKKMKIAIGGKLTEIEGNGSEIQVSFMKDNKPKIKLLKGHARIKNARGKSIVLVTNTFTSLENEPPKRALAEVQVVPTEPVAPIIPEMPIEPVEIETPTAQSKMPPLKPKVQVKAIPIKRPIVYTDRFYDLFDTRQGSLFLRDKRETFIKTKIDIAWSTGRNNSTDVFGQLSNTPAFTSISDSFVVKAPATSYYFTKAHLGKNFYRLSPDGKEWGPVQTLIVRAEPLNIRPPQLKAQLPVNIIEQTAVLPIQPQGNREFTNFIVELSETKDFKPQTTKVYFTSNEGLRLPFTKAQTLFVRLRGANMQTELSASSPVTKVDIKQPAWPKAPQLSQKEYNIYEDESANLMWQSSAKKILIEWINEKNIKLDTELVTGNSKEITNLAPGKYKIKLSGLDDFGRKSKKSSQVLVTVNPRPQMAESSTQYSRNPSAVGSSSLRLEKNIPRYLNREYPSSKISVEGAGFSIYSQEQVEQGRQIPTATTFGLRVMSWLGENGFEGAFKTKVATITSAQSSEASPTQFEARYHRRLNIPFNPLSGLGTSQLSFIVGYESYRNPSTDYFISRYDIIKAGLSFTLPIYNQWDTGAEMLYGINLNQSKKYEVAGFVNYYLKSDWSIGVGYRANVFEASAYNSPTGAPYREAYSEGSSVLRWSY